MPSAGQRWTPGTSCPGGAVHTASARISQPGPLSGPSPAALRSPRPARRSTCFAEARALILQHSSNVETLRAPGVLPGRREADSGRSVPQSLPAGRGEARVLRSSADVPDSDVTARAALEQSVAVERRGRGLRSAGWAGASWALSRVSSGRGVSSGWTSVDGSYEVVGSGSRSTRLNCTPSTAPRRGLGGERPERSRRSRIFTMSRGRLPRDPPRRARRRRARRARITSCPAIARAIRPLLRAGLSITASRLSSGFAHRRSATTGAGASRRTSLHAWW